MIVEIPTKRVVCLTYSQIIVNFGEGLDLRNIPLTVQITAGISSKIDVIFHVDYHLRKHITLFSILWKYVTQNWK